MTLEKDKESLLAAREELQVKLSTVVARIESIQDVIAKIKTELVTSEKQDYQAKALLISGLELEQQTLTEVLVNLKNTILPLNSRLESLNNAIYDRDNEAKEKALREKITALKSQGESPKTVRETLGLSQREYERLVA